MGLWASVGLFDFLIGYYFIVYTTVDSASTISAFSLIFQVTIRSRSTQNISFSSTTKLIPIPFLSFSFPFLSNLFNFCNF